MINLIDCEDLGKELGISFEINYNNLKILNNFTYTNKLPQGFFKTLIVHANPLSTLNDRILKELFGSSGVLSYTLPDEERNVTVIKACVGLTAGFKYYSFYIFYNHRLNEIKK